MGYYESTKSMYSRVVSSKKDCSLGLIFGVFDLEVLKSVENVQIDGL